MIETKSPETVRERERELQFSKINRYEIKVEIPLFEIKEDRVYLKY